MSTIKKNFSTMTVAVAVKFYTIGAAAKNKYLLKKEI
jgi:hypothetical protein